MTAWSNQNKNTSSWTNQGLTYHIPAGSPIGLLLALTYAIGAKIQWSNQTKNPTSFTNQVKH